MDPAAQSAAITALAAIAGSVVGGLASFLTTFFTQRNQAHRLAVTRRGASRRAVFAVHQRSGEFVRRFTGQNPGEPR